MTKFKGTKDWFPVEFAGFYTLKTEPFYESNDLFDMEHVGIDTAKANIKLASKAPEMLEMLEEVLGFELWDGTKTPELKERIEKLIKEATDINEK